MPPARSRLYRCMVSDGEQKVLCRKHRSSKEVTAVLEPVAGGAWKCEACTLLRVIMGGDESALAVGVSGYTVTKYPYEDRYHCTCMSWRFSRLPVQQRRCKHIEMALEDSLFDKYARPV